ncbi:MAG: VLRF1 family aeRF1-type release factor [Anaerolineae bacterium]|jgi:hypothetical protein|nr:VLRF1 family aeRF1-type release factor [Anaerolineae bacterium]
MIDIDDVKSVVRLTDPPLLTLYLQIDNALPENQAQFPAWYIWAKNALQNYEADHHQDLFEQARDRVMETLETYRPQGKGLVLFFGRDLERIYELPVLPHENLMSFGEGFVAPLMWLIDEFEPYLIVMVTKDEAHFLRTYLGDIQRQDQIASDRFTFDYRELTRMPYTVGPRGQNMTYPGGSDRDSFDDMMDEQITKFFRDVAQHVRELQGKHGRNRIIIGGSEQSAKAVYKLLHEEVAKNVVEVVSLPAYESDYQIMQRVLPIAIEYERKTELEIVDQVIDFTRSGGRGALGLEDVREALEMQRVELLVMPLRNGDVSDRLLHELTLKVFDSGGRVEIVHGEAADRLNQEGGVGARLYYAL